MNKKIVMSGLFVIFLLVFSIQSVSAASYGSVKFYGYTMTANVSIGVIGEAYATTSISPTEQITVYARVKNAQFAYGTPVSSLTANSKSSAKATVYGQGRCIKAFGEHYTYAYSGYQIYTDSFY